MGTFWTCGRRSAPDTTRLLIGLCMDDMGRDKVVHGLAEPLGSAGDIRVGCVRCDPASVELLYAERNGLEPA